MRKLAIIVNCTERKSVKPAPALQARALPSGGLNVRFETWASRINAAQPVVALSELYQGEAWAQAKLLHAEAASAGFDTHLMVASAGLGLRSAMGLGPAYAATFSGGHADTVARGVVESRLWWRSLEELDGSHQLHSIVDSSILLVLSESYARAMDAELVELAERGGDLLLVGGARDIDGLPRLPADRALRSSLGGTASSVSHRMARAWMAKRRSPSLFDPKDVPSWTAWRTSVRKVEDYSRSPVSDADVRDLIALLLTNDVTLSATRALRQLRDSGVACEQRRFRRIFLDMREERG